VGARTAAARTAKAASLFMSHRLHRNGRAMG